MKKTLITLIIGTLLLFIWNVISWMALPFHSKSLITLPDAAFKTQQLQDLLLEDGIYHYPGLPESNTPEGLRVIEEKLKKGPRISFMSYKKGSTKFFEPSTYLKNIFLNFMTMLLVWYMVRKQANHRLSSIITTTLCMGLLIGFASDFPQMNWFKFPWNYTLPNILDHLVGFSLLGLLLSLYTFKVTGV